METRLNPARRAHAAVVLPMHSAGRFRTFFRRSPRNWRKRPETPEPLLKYSFVTAPFMRASLSLCESATPRVVYRGMARTVAPRARNFPRMSVGAISERGKSMRLSLKSNLRRSWRGPTEINGTEVLISRSCRTCLKNLRAFWLVKTIKSKRSIFWIALSEERDKGERRTSTRILSVRAIDSFALHRASQRFSQMLAIAPRSAEFFSIYRAVSSERHCGKETIFSDAGCICAGR